MTTINPEMRELQGQVAELRDRLAKAEGKIEQVNRTATDTTRQTIWQFVIFTVTMAAVLLGGLNYQTEALRRESGARFESVEKRFESLEKRIEQSERNLTARFDDLKQAIRESRQ